MTAKARGKGKIVVFQEDSPERPGDGSADRGAEFRSIAHLKMLHGVSTKLSRLNDVAAIGATIADELRLLIDYHNCRVFVREGDDLRPIAFRGDLSASGSATGPARDPRRRRHHGARRGDRRAVPHGRRRALHDRRPDPGDGRDRGVPPRRPVPVRPDRGRRDRRLEARARPVRRGRPPAPRGARGPRVGGARERTPLRGAAARGREREGAARADARALRRDGPRRRAHPGGDRNRADHGVAALLRLAAGAGRRARSAARPTATRPTRSLQGRSIPAAIVARCSERSEPFVLGARDAAVLARALDARDLATPHAVAFIPIDHGLAAPRGRDRVRRRRPRARAARGNREPGTARDHERGELRDARADVPLDRRGARERARGEGLVHVVAHPLDLRHGDRGRRASSASRARGSSGSSSARSSTTSGRSASRPRSS